MSTEKIAFFDTSSSSMTGQFLVTPGAFAGIDVVELDEKENPDVENERSKAIEDAVYGFLQAVRALGRNKVATYEVATSLKLSVSDVESALVALRRKGVKLAA